MSSLPAQRNLWTLRLYYFLLIGGGGFLFPFINLFYTQQGLSGTEIGWLSTVASLVALIAAPWWGRRSDATTHPRRLLQFGLLATSLCMLALSQQTVFAWMALIVMLDALLSIKVAPLSDVVALAVTKQGRAGFGSVRLWGSLGWAVTALVGGWLIEQTGLFTMFAGYAISGFASIALLAMLQMPRWGQHADRTEARRSGSDASLAPTFASTDTRSNVVGIGAGPIGLVVCHQRHSPVRAGVSRSTGRGRDDHRAGEHHRGGGGTAGDVVGRSVGAASRFRSVAAHVVLVVHRRGAQRGHRADDSGDSLLARDRRRGVQFLRGGAGALHRARSRPIGR